MKKSECEINKMYMHVYYKENKPAGSLALASLIMSSLGFELLYYLYVIIENHLPIRVKKGTKAF